HHLAGLGAHIAGAYHLATFGVEWNLPRAKEQSPIGGNGLAIRADGPRCVLGANHNSCHLLPHLRSRSDESAAANGLLNGCFSGFPLAGADCLAGLGPAPRLGSSLVVFTRSPAASGLAALGSRMLSPIRRRSASILITRTETRSPTRTTSA